MAPRGAGPGDDAGRRGHAERIVQLIAALSTIQEPMRTVGASLRAVLADHPSHISDELVFLLKELSEAERFFTPAAALAVDGLVPLLGNGDGSWG